MMLSQATTKLANITFEAPAKIKTIGTFAFQGSGLTELNIPASLEVVSWSAFGSTKLKKVLLQMVHSYNPLIRQLSMGVRTLKNLPLRVLLP